MPVYANCLRVLTLSTLAKNVRYFAAQLELAARVQLPLFLHLRDAGDDFLEIITPFCANGRLAGGVVHSFDGSAQLAHKLLELGLYIGINGCSLKTAANLEVVRTIPADRLLIETDAPWCEIRPTHAGHAHIQTKVPVVKPEKFVQGSAVKNRNEPAMLVQVLEVIAGIRGESKSQVAEIFRENSRRLFGV